VRSISDGGVQVVYKGTRFYHGDQALRYIYMYI
jgi:hypothetical protein